MKKSKLLNKNKRTKKPVSKNLPRWRRIGAVGLLLVSLILLISFVSYLYTWKMDQDKVLHFGWDLFLQTDLDVRNWLGRLGAIVSSQFFYWGFGVTSFVFVIYTALLAGLLYFKFNWKALITFSKYLLLAVAYFPIVFEFIFNRNPFPWGGVYGQMSYAWLTGFLGVIGTFLLLSFVGLGIAVWHDQMIPEAGWSANALRMKIKEWADKLTPKGWSEEVGEEPSKSKTIEKESDHEAEKPSKESTVPMEAKEQTIQPIEDTFDMQTEAIEESLNTNEEQKEEEDFEIQIANTSESVEKQEAEESESKEIPARAVLDVELENQMENLEPYDPTAELSEYRRPSLELLIDHQDGKIEIDRSELEENKNQIVRTLEHYKIKIEKIRATVGPTVTLYEIVPEPGVRISKIKNLEDDIALSLAALGIRIIAPIPGKGTIGIEVPNKKKQIVGLKEILLSDKFKEAKMELPIALGKTISNEVFVGDLAKMPHLLIAGATGQGKSVGINTVITSLLYKKHPSQIKLILIDPKKVELFPYSKLDKHFLAYLPGEDEPIITDTKKVVNTLNSLCIEMDNRYDLLKKAHVRNIKEYNRKFVARKLNPNKGHDFMPFIVLIIDEFADLIMTAGKDVELPIARLAQLARAVGIHLIVATQRPSVNIITGVIKANFPARLAFKVTSKVDSRTILDTGGADQLIGRGDMLLSVGGGDLVRLQCAFIDTPEVEAVIDDIAGQRGYAEPFYLPEFVGDDADSSDPGAISVKDLDENFEDAARLIVSSQHGSTSMIQRRMKLGYNRAGRIMDQLEAFGVVGENQGSKSRDVLIQTEVELEEHLSQIRKAASAAATPY